MLDRLTDAGYSHADTFAVNTELRNQGSIADVVLDEEKRDLERTIERLKFQDQLSKFFEAHPELKPASDSTGTSKPKKPRTKRSNLKNAGTG
jgi:hypothetical protein